MSSELHRSWEELDALYRAAAEPGVSHVAEPGTPAYDISLAFALGRLDEGRRVGDFFVTTQNRPLRMLDVGAGSGGVALGVANYKAHEVHGLDILPNVVFRDIRRQLGNAPTQVVGSGHNLPYRNETFDVVLCLETLEHIPDPPALGREVMRVLRPGGVCMIMTPARVKHLLRPDPHYGIRGLLLLPDAWQRFVTVRLLKRTPASAYDVTHTFWTLRGIAKLFPGSTGVHPLFNVPRPQSRLWMRFKDLLWDRVIVTK